MPASARAGVQARAVFRNMDVTGEMTSKIGGQI